MLAQGRVCGRQGPCARRCCPYPDWTFCACDRWPLPRFDHIYGVRRTAAGKVRRLDIILAPSEEFAMALVGWTGSRTYLRLLRQHAKDVGMYLNSHR